MYKQHLLRPILKFKTSAKNGFLLKATAHKKTDRWHRHTTASQSPYTHPPLLLLPTNSLLEKNNLYQIKNQTPNSFPAALKEAYLKFGEF